MSISFSPVRGRSRPTTPGPCRSPLLPLGLREVRPLSADRDLVDDLAVRRGHHDVRCFHGVTLVAVVRPPDVRHECGLLDAE